MSRIEAALERVAPRRSVASVSRPAEGNSEETAIVTFDDGERVVVQCSDDPAASRAETRLVREIGARTPVPVPEVLDAGRLNGGRYRVTEHVEGTNLHERFGALGPAARTRIARRFGWALGAVHDAFAFDRYGGLTADNGGLVPTGTNARPGAYGRWFEAYAEAGIDALPPCFEDLEGPLVEAVERAGAPADPTPRLFPWDLRPGNAVVADGEIAAFLDWGGPLAAGAGLAVAKAERLVCEWYVEDPEPLRRAFRAGYASVRPVPTVRRADRLVATVRSAVDGEGEVTRPGYPEREGAAAVAFHRDRLEALL